MAETRCKYYKQKRQVSYDGGATWQDVIPYQYQKGALYEHESADCGAVVVYRWVNMDASVDYYCEGTTKYYKQKRQVSYDGGQTWQDVSPAEYQRGGVAEQRSTDCGYVPPTPQYRWIKSDDTICVESSESQYLTFTALESGTFRTVENYAGIKYYYSLDNGSTWVELPVDEDTPTVNSGQKIMFKGVTSSFFRPRHFSSTGRFAAEGNPMSIPYGDDFVGKTNLPDDAFLNMFSGCVGLVNIDNIVLPPTTSYNCYYGMFAGCTSLATVPSNLLPATTLSTQCYFQMFAGCTSLVKAPDLPAPTMVSNCYSSMFDGCTNLNYIKCLATSSVVPGPTVINTRTWIRGVSSTGTFVQAPGTTVWLNTDYQNGIPSGWTVIDNE